MATLYDRLGVDPSASAAELRRACRRLARTLHPDTAGGDVDRMAAVNEAWAVLSDPGRRARYDAALLAGSDDGDEPGPDGEHTDGARLLAAHGGRRRRPPVVTIAVLVVLAVVFVGSAYARRTDTPTTPTDRSVDGVSEPGSCVQLLPGDLADEVPCSGPHAGTVSAVLALGVECPSPTAAAVDRRLRTVCLRPGDGSGPPLVP